MATDVFISLWLKTYKYVIVLISYNNLLYYFQCHLPINISSIYT